MSSSIDESARFGRWSNPDARNDAVYPMGERVMTIIISFIDFVTNKNKKGCFFKENIALKTIINFLGIIELY